MPSKQRFQTQNRVRAFKPKVRTGCITCKIRRVKCDEEKPDCQKCTSTGRKCDGYLTPLPSSNSPLTLKISHSLESELFGSGPERRTFDFFCKRTVGILSGIFDPTFWTRLVLQATHHEPAIKHAVIALGALHETFELGSRDKPSIFAMQQYGKAIRCLVKPIQGKQKQAADVALMTCVLFVCFETMRGHHGTAISHIKSGVKIISELQPRTKPTDAWPISAIPYAEPSVLNLIFLRLDRKASIISAKREILPLDQVLDDEASGYREDVPLIITNLEQARISLENIGTFTMRLRKSAISQHSFSDPVKKVQTIEVLKNLSFIKRQQWSAAFKSFIQNYAEFDVAGQEAIHELSMHRVVMDVMMEIDEERAFADEMIWDQYKSQYESIISHAISVIDLSIGSCEKEGRKRWTFYLDSGIIFPLFLVASKCRDGAIRRKSIELLRATDRQEGVFNTFMVAKVAERLLSIEEEGLVGKQGFVRASEVPRENRLGGLQFQWMTDRCVYLSYIISGRRMVGGDEYNRETLLVEELLEW